MGEPARAWPVCRGRASSVGTGGGHATAAHGMRSMAVQRSRGVQTLTDRAVPTCVPRQRQSFDRTTCCRSWHSTESSRGTSRPSSPHYRCACATRAPVHMGRDAPKRGEGEAKRRERAREVSPGGCCRRIGLCRELSTRCLPCLLCPRAGTSHRDSIIAIHSLGAQTPGMAGGVACCRCMPRSAVPSLQGVGPGSRQGPSEQRRTASGGGRCASSELGRALTHPSYSPPLVSTARVRRWKLCGFFWPREVRALPQRMPGACVFRSGARGIAWVGCR